MWLPDGTIVSVFFDWINNTTITKLLTIISCVYLNYSLLWMKLNKSFSFSISFHLYYFKWPLIYFGYNWLYVIIPVVGRRAGPGRSAGRSRWGFSTVVGRFAPPQDSLAQCCRAGLDCLPPELCLSGPADSTWAMNIKTFSSSKNSPGIYSAFRVESLQDKKDISAL